MTSKSLGRESILNVRAESDRDLVLTDEMMLAKGSKRKWVMDLAVDEYREACLATILSSQA